MSALRETEPQPGEKPFIRFVFVSHHRWPDNPNPILSAFDDANVIFLETVGSSSEKRNELEGQYNLILARPETLDEENRIRQDYYCLYIQPSKHFADQLILGLRQTGKQLYLVDIDESHPTFLQIVTANKIQADMMNELRRGNLQKGRELYKDVHALKGERNRIREKVIAAQITNITNELMQNEKTVRAVVIQGSIHTGTPNHLENNFDIETQIFPTEHSYYDELCFKSAHEEPISDDEFDRSLLADFLLIEATSGNPEQDFKRVTGLVHNLTSEEVAAAINTFSHDYPMYLRRITGDRRLTEAEKNNYAPFAFQTTVRNLLKTLEAKTS